MTLNEKIKMNKTSTKLKILKIYINKKIIIV